MSIAITNQRQLERVLRYWQRRLRLTDWTVSIRFARRNEENAIPGTAQACCEWSLEAKKAEILILDARDYDPSQYPSNEPQDVENSVVHELLHLHLAPWRVKSGSTDETFQEQAIELITAALVSLKRRER